MPHRASRRQGKHQPATYATTQGARRSEGKAQGAVAAGLPATQPLTLARKETVVVHVLPEPPATLSRFDPEYRAGHLVEADQLALRLREQSAQQTFQDVIDALRRDNPHIPREQLEQRVLLEHFAADDVDRFAEIANAPEAGHHADAMTAAKVAAAKISRLAAVPMSELRNVPERLESIAVTPQEIAETEMDRNFARNFVQQLIPRLRSHYFSEYVASVLEQLPVADQMRPAAQALVVMGVISGSVSCEVSAPQKSMEQVDKEFVTRFVSELTKALHSGYTFATAVHAALSDSGNDRERARQSAVQVLTLQVLRGVMKHDPQSIAVVVRQMERKE